MSVDVIKISDTIDRIVAADRQLVERYIMLEKSLSGRDRPEPVAENSARSRHIQRGVLNIIRKITEEYNSEMAGVVCAMMGACDAADRVINIGNKVKVVA